MKYSELKRELDLLKLNHEHDLKLLETKYEYEYKELINKCNHRYDDGTIAKIFKGGQFDSYYECDICGTII